MKKAILAFAVCLSVCALSSAQAGYVPSEDNLQARKAVSDARLGIFIHWGVYSMLGDGEWVMQKQNIDYREYARLSAGFYPSKFDAREWVRAFKDAGAGYVTFTSRHHDGFSMWNSAASSYNVVKSTPFGRDVIAELSEACREEGLRLHLYYSHLDWGRLDYWPLGRTGHGTGRPEGDAASWDSYKRFMNAQLTELLTGYGPIGCIWFDGVWDKCKGRREIADEVWGLSEQYALIHRLQPSCLVANNHHMQPFEGEDLQIFERDIPGAENAKFNDGQTPSDLIPMETCQTMNKHWGYDIHDVEYKSGEELVRLLVSTAGKGANLLLNIGPRPDGTLPEAALERLQYLGEWMRRYGNESVKGTQGGIIEAQPWGVVTRKGNVLYAHILNPVESIALPMTAIKGVTTFEGEKVAMPKIPRKAVEAVIPVPERPEGLVDQILKITLK